MTEQLEEIKDVIKKARDYINPDLNNGDVDYGRHDELVLSLFDNKKIDSLIEQAERKMNLIRTIDNLRNEKRDLQEQNKHYHNLLKSISDTHDMAKEIQKENPDIKVITPDDLLQHILRKVNGELESESE